ncbi:MAG: hypothetical protein HON04_00955 [Planctomicrobium sp.]|nr:hypothetical protein [Planctomicrobium sp.]
MSSSTKQPELDSNYVSPLRVATPYLIAAWIFIFWARFFLSVLPSVGSGDLDRVDVLFIVPDILWNLVFPDHSQNDSVGWSHLAQRIPIIIHALFIFLSAYSLGRILLRGMKLQQSFDVASHTALAGSLGLATVSLVTLDLGYFGILSRTLFGILLLIPIVFETYLWFKERRVKKIQQSVERSKSFRILFAGSIIFLIPMLLGAMLPSTDFDVKEYHLEGPKEYFLEGRVHFLPHNVYTSFPFLTEMLTLCGMVLTNDWFTGALVGKTVLMMFAPLTALGVFAVGKRVANSTAGLLGALVYLSTPWAYRISIIAYTEGAMCCYVIVTLLALLIWLDAAKDSNSTASQRRSLTLLLGLLSGCAIATKYPGLVMVAIPVALTLLATVILRKFPLRESLIMAGIYILGGLVSFGPWVIKNSLETGNPVYPLMYSVFGGEDWNEELNEKWKAGHARPSPVFKAPTAMAQELKKNVVDVALGSVWQSPLMFGLAPLALFWRKREKRFWIVVGAAATLLLVWYTLTHLLDRFWVPVLPVIAVLSGVAWVVVYEFFHTGQHRNSLSQLLIGKSITCLFAVTLVYNFAFMTTDASGYSAYFIDYEVAREQVKPDSLRIAENAMTPGDRVLFVGEAMVFDADLEYRYNTVFDHSLFEKWTSRKLGEKEWELLSAKEIAERFHEEGITHVLVNWNEVLRYRTTYGYTDFVSPSRLKELNDLWRFVEVPIPDEYNLKEWNELAPSWQNEIEAWGPELKQTSQSGQLSMKKYQLFKLDEGQ